MKYIESPEIYSNNKTLFLAGGIQGCENWQKRMVELLKDTHLTILNPRREIMLDDDLSHEEQIIWEFEHLHLSDMISFWFSPETLNPTTLYEFGYWISKPKKLFIGIHPEYKKKATVEIQTSLALERLGKTITIASSIDELAAQIIHFTY